MLKSPTKWYLASLALFWGAVAGFTFVDFVGDRWFGVAWPTGPDFFPNQVLGVPLALCQLAAAGLMLVTGWKARLRRWHQVGPVVLDRRGRDHGRRNVRGLRPLWPVVRDRCHEPGLDVATFRRPVGAWVVPAFSGGTMIGSC